MCVRIVASVMSGGINCETWVSSSTNSQTKASSSTTHSVLTIEFQILLGLEGICIRIIRIRWIDLLLNECQDFLSAKHPIRI